MPLFLLYMASTAVLQSRLDINQLRLLVKQFIQRTLNKYNYVTKSSFVFAWLHKNIRIIKIKIFIDNL